MVMNSNPRLVAAFLLTLCLVEAACAGSTAQDENQAKQWLERMIQAAQSLNYEGTFVYIQGEHVESMRIVHGNDDGAIDGSAEWQHMYSLNGARREVVVADNQVMCVLPKQRVAFSGLTQNQSPFPISLPRDLAKLEMVYRFKVLGDDRIAGLRTRIIEIQPRDELRFGYRLWLDYDTGMVLRSALLNEHGQIVEQIMFTELHIMPTNDASLRASREAVDRLIASKPRIKPSTGEVVAHSDWTVTHLPHGFTRVMHNRYPGTSLEPSTEHMVFTDGLATVSIFLETLEGDQVKLKGPSRMGAMNAFAVVLGPYQVMVIGEVPEATVKMMAFSLARNTGVAAK